MEGDGYYITYYLDRGKSGGSDENIKEDQAEKIAPAKTRISYTDDKGKSHNMWETGNTTLILTYDRATGGFRQIQTERFVRKKFCSSLLLGKISLSMTAAVTVGLLQLQGAAVRSALT